ncbi:MAG TPA: sigma-54 dependent transcriptional regulator [Steroidobacteraceae bacterium]|nr:sigma-54 dependent transcriptional regulator [Steroidobacteraceae bacterium]
MQPRLLVADDQQDVLTALRLLLGKEGIEVALASSPAGALDAVRATRFDAALIDLNYARDTTSGMEGLDLLARLKQVDPNLPVIVMTAWATIGVAVEVMRAGARDFIEKPWENQRLLAVIRNQLELGRALRRSQRLEAENALLRGASDPNVVAESPPMQEALAIARRVADSDAPVLITGENGTGKSLLARLLHGWSRRRERSLIEVNIGALPDGVFESEMFGHVKGAFTDARQERTGRFELADGGTLFLDEVGNLPAGQQAKLLRVLESGEFEPVGSSRTRRVDVRLISATNADLGQRVTAGLFRQDLMFRINTVEIHVPPLRQRAADILPLASAALADAARRYGRRLAGFDPQAMRALTQYAWPGNVRELRNVVERAVLLAGSEVVGIGDLRLGAAVDAGPPALEEMSLEDAERALIRAALRRHAGSATAAAQALGLSRSAMYRRMEKLGIATDG